MNNITTTRGLSSFSIKYLAMFLMILDHIHYFFEYTGKVPLFFTWAGRAAAPLFLFCIVEGFLHTHNRTAYFLRIYALSVLMGLIQFSFYNIGSCLIRPDGFFPQNQMLASFALLIVLLQGIDSLLQRRWFAGFSCILGALFLPALAFFVLSNIFHAGFLANLLAFTLLPVHFFIMDGGTSTLIFGTVLYLFHKRPGVQAAAFCCTVILFDVVRLLISVPGLSLTDFFSLAYQWMEIFAVIPMLCYNGKRGHGSKSLFYWFYPVHIYILYGLSCILFFHLA